jgi:hypothetical protein
MFLGCDGKCSFSYKFIENSATEKKRMHTKLNIHADFHPLLFFHFHLLEALVFTLYSRDREVCMKIGSVLDRLCCVLVVYLTIITTVIE